MLSLSCYQLCCYYCDLQVTWFVALLTLDERRVERHRNGCCCCLVSAQHREKQEEGEGREGTQQNDHTKLGVISRLFGWISEKLILWPIKVLVLLTCLSLLGLGVFGISQLKVEFRPEWMLDPESEFTSWYFTHKEYFPSDGELGQLYFKVSHPPPGSP